MSEDKEKSKESVMTQMKAMALVVDVGNAILAETQKQIAKKNQYKTYSNRAVK